MLFLELWFWMFAAVAVGVFWLCPTRLRVLWLVMLSVGGGIAGDVFPAIA